MTMPSAQTFTLELFKKEQITPDICSFYFASNDAIAFIGGQYLQLTLPHKNPDARGTSRFFSIASSPNEEYVMLTIRKGKSSFKKTLFALESGAKISGFGPIGKFTLNI